MIRPRYALKLARTKLRSKRGILITSVIVASILFAALITMIIVFTGAEKSANAFIKKAGNDRYLVKTAPNIPYEKISFGYPLSIEDIRTIRAYEKKYYETLEARYKSLGLPYDKTTHEPALTPNAYADPTIPSEQRYMINYKSPVIEQLNADKFADYVKTATNKFAHLQELGAAYGASGYYKVDEPSYLPSLPALRLVQNSKEDFTVNEPKSGNMSPYGYYINSAYNGNYSFDDQRLLGRYLLTTDAANLKGIPVIISAQEAASLFGEAKGIGKEPQSPAEKRTWLQAIQSKLNGQTYQACYRNEVERSLIQKIQRDYADIKNNEKTDGYVKPSLLYRLPTSACGDITVAEDTRTQAEKQAELAEQQAQKKLGTYDAPMHQLLTFQIVGIRYAQDINEGSRSVTDFVKSLLVSQGDYSSSLSIPKQMYDALPSTMKFDTIRNDFKARSTQDVSATDDFAQRVLEFTSVDKARSFLQNEACSFSETNCTKRFLATPYGSNYLIVDEIGKLFNKIALIAFPAVLALATLIIWFTVSRIMAENRKETAVYRAMGAKRRDVTAVYLVYIVLVATQIASASLVIGVGAALVVNYLYGPTLTDTATNAFGIVSGAPQFSLFNLESPLLLIVIASIFVISIVASAQPLLRNVRRSPIRDMRDE